MDAGYRRVMTPPDSIDVLLAQDPVANLLGIQRVTASPVAVVALVMTVRPEHLNFVGIVHGGIVFTLADTALALASNGFGRGALAVDAHIVLSAKARVGDTLTAEAHEVADSRRLATYRIPVVRSDGRILASFDGTVFRPDGN